MAALYSPMMPENGKIKCKNCALKLQTKMKLLVIKQKYNEICPKGVIQINCDKFKEVERF